MEDHDKSIKEILEIPQPTPEELERKLSNGFMPIDPVMAIDPDFINMSTSIEKAKLRIGPKSQAVKLLPDLFGLNRLLKD